MKTYIEPSTILLSVNAQTIICVSEPPQNYTGGDPATAQAPQRLNYLKF